MYFNARPIRHQGMPDKSATKRLASRLAYLTAVEKKESREPSSALCVPAALWSTAEHVLVQTAQVEDLGEVDFALRSSAAAEVGPLP